MIKLSIIVPVYNVENYLAKCLDSLLNQDIPITDYEILVINDGATDQSPNIAALYAKQNAHIKLVHQDNQGLGAARNTGIKLAVGKYIQFVDSDDYLEKGVLNVLLDKMKWEDLDVLRFNYQLINEENTLIPKTKNMYSAIIFDEKIVSGNFFLTNQLGFACYAWQFIIKRELLVEKSLFFNEAIFYEDVDWLIRTLLQSHRVSSLNVVVYNYLQRKGSITKSVSLEKKNKIIDDKIILIEFLSQKIIERANCLEKNWFMSMVSLIIISLLSYTQKNLLERKDEVITKIKNYKPFMGSYHFTLKQMRDLIILRCSPHLYCYLKK